MLRSTRCCALLKSSRLWPSKVCSLRVARRSNSQSSLAPISSAGRKSCATRVYNLIKKRTIMFTEPAVNVERKALYERMDEHHLTPLWEVLGALVPAQPTTPCVPALWRYDVVRAFLMESGRVITAREA